MGRTWLELRCVRSRPPIEATGRTLQGCRWTKALARHARVAMPTVRRAHASRARKPTWARHTIDLAAQKGRAGAFAHPTSKVEAPRLLHRRRLIIEIEIADLVIDRARVPHAALRIDEELPHRDLRMRIRILDHLAGLGIEATERVLLVRGVPDHMVAIDADRVGARLRAGQREFLERLGLGIETTDPVAAPLAEPDDAVVIDLDALRLALGGRIELR